jgi:cytochrome c biogenesis protein CcmG, thiol:disulfide interchange protein DsbE
VSVTDPPPLDDGVEPDAGAARRPHTTRWLALGVGAVCLALVALLAFRDGTHLDRPSRLVGLRVPEVAGPSITDGAAYRIDDARGRWVVVNFFASWCPPCVREQPELARFAAWGRETGRADLVGVVFQDPDAQEFLARNGGTWPVIDDPGVAVAFQVANVPESFLVAPSGLVVQRIQGELRAEDLIRLIDAYEAGPSGDGS